MSEELRSFMRTGLEKYPEAFAAVDRFQSEVQRTISDVLVSRERWNAFAPNAKPSTNAGGRAGKGCWVYATLTGTLPRKPKDMIEVGMWWDAPGATRLVIYANPYWGAKDLEALRRASPAAPVRVGTLDGKARFFAEVSPEEELAPQIERVVDELTKFFDHPSWTKSVA
jgi:hypothetical protein